MIFIASAGLDFEIGFQNDLLFHCPEDMKFFKSQTVGNTVIMGKRTFLSLPKQNPLPDRENIVLSTDPNFSPEGVTVVRSVDSLLEKVKDIKDRKVFVIGGGMIYNLLLPYCDTALITQFYEKRTADCFLPNISKDPDWKLISRSEIHNYNGLEYSFDVYNRI